MGFRIRKPRFVLSFITFEVLGILISKEWSNDSNDNSNNNNTDNSLFQRRVKTIFLHENFCSKKDRNTHYFYDFWRHDPKLTTK